jgi:hypothetical protein
MNHITHFSRTGDIAKPFSPPYFCAIIIILSIGFLSIIYFIYDKRRDLKKLQHLTAESF